MKIQDIFNLPKNRGGAKLFQRIMNRYGIPKEDSKELKNNIDNSSSGGGSKIGVYYKLNKKGVGVDSANDTLYAQFKQENLDGSIDITNKTSAYSSIIAVAMYPLGNKDLFIHSLEEYYTFEIKYENPDITDEELNDILKDEVFSKFTPITEQEYYNLK